MHFRLGQLSISVGRWTACPTGQDSQDWEDCWGTSLQQGDHFRRAMNDYAGKESYNNRAAERVATHVSQQAVADLRVRTLEHLQKVHRVALQAEAFDAAKATLLLPFKAQPRPAPRDDCGKQPVEACGHAIDGLAGVERGQAGRTQDVRCQAGLLALLQEAGIPTGLRGRLRHPAPGELEILAHAELDELLAPISLCRGM